MVHYNKLVYINANERDKNKNLFYQRSNKQIMTVSEKEKMEQKEARAS